MPLAHEARLGLLELRESAPGTCGMLWKRLLAPATRQLQDLTREAQARPLGTQRTRIMNGKLGGAEGGPGATSRRPTPSKEPKAMQEIAVQASFR